ncbi:GntR family transcriptional regulator [Pseudoroseomonas deserti]|uniref:GntR family transcriptional regulator n=1 Tax=Teichococcus deserti TaxID=1817963 RepID=A0A1V2H6X7_9PROT|nr:GntR family transcriptional regulator [Pseudoroseomonas deserti]ONG58172.1 GntR family transcriptional regulator [Pseudoroseomonas deserti]
MDEQTVGEGAYRRIRADILFGRLAPGQRLGLDAMRERYGASVSTLRELLSRLSSEALVVAEGQRGFEVAPVSAADFREVAALRLLLEEHALKESFSTGRLEWEGRVVAAHHKLAALERALLAGDAAEPAQWKRYDWEFHHALISACGSQALLQAHAAVYDRYLRYQMVAVVFRGAIAAEEHQRLLDHALARDVGAAQAVLRAHVDGCVEQVLAAGLLDPFTRAPAAESPPRRKRAG